MSYGQNAPWGLQAVRTQTDASWNGKTSTYLIASGYANNIFKGDLVYIFTNGYIQNLYNFTGNAYTTAPALGVFDGCSFAVPTSVNPIDPANPGRPYWPSGQQTVGGIPAVAFVITDPNVVYNVQCVGATGATQANVAMNADAVYTTIGNQVQGNFNTGISSLGLTLDGAVRGNNTHNFFIDALSSNPNNVSGQQYNNVEVMISNHFFRLMPATPGA
jgi:hypothetical protein